MAPLNVLNEQKPRQIAARILRQREAGEEFVEHLLEQTLLNTRLSAADRGLCQEIVYGVVRWQATLDWLIGRKTNGREQKPALQNLLRLGLYQIFWLDRIPDHAAVHETVEQAKESGFGPQAGFINAVLRGYLREADATRQLLAELKTKEPAVGYSQPDWLVARWQQRWGAEKTAQLLAWNNTPPKTFARVNRLKFRKAELIKAKTGETKSQARGTRPCEFKDVGDLLTRWREENVEYDFKTCDWTGENLVFELKSHPPLNSLASFRDGWFYIQDPSTLLAVCELNPQPGETILDLCAAPGGKTTFIAQLMNNQGRIVAQDVSEDRLKLVRENCTRLGVRGVQTQCAAEILSAKQAKVSPAGKMPAARYDRILVDAPCSNTGVMRRRVDLRWRIQPEEIERLRTTQLELLNKAATQLKPGGTLVYSTCSLEPEENVEVVKRFLAVNPGFTLAAERQLLPFADNVDGAYVARLKK